MKHFFFLFFLLTQNSFAFKLSPMTQELEVGKKNRKAIFTIINNGTKPIAIIAELKKRVIQRDGREVNSEVGDEFMIFPDQMIIQAGQKRAVQVTWLGKGQLKTEEAYRFIAEQLPIDVDLKKSKKEKANIKILLKYRAAFYLTPESASSKIILKSNNLVEKGKVLFTLSNQGNKHELLRDYSLKLSGKDKIELIDFSKIEGLFGENLLAQSERDFSIPIPENMKGIDEVKVDLVKK